MSILVSIGCIYLAIGLGVGICYQVTMYVVADAYDEDIPKFGTKDFKFILNTMVFWPRLIRDMTKEVEFED